MSPSKSTSKSKMTLPTIIIDTREQTPLIFENLLHETSTLYSGDYSVKGMEELFTVERKPISDLVGSVIQERQRFSKELHRLRGCRFKRHLVIGERDEIEKGAYQSGAKPRAVLASLAAFEARYDIPVVFALNAEQAAIQVERWAFWAWREQFKITGVSPTTPPWAI